MPRQAILFLIDTQGTHLVGCYAGRQDLGTPHIDRLASQGIRFDRAYTCSPVCGPARSALFTGLYPHTNGVLGNNQAPEICFPTIGERLHKAGVATGYIGKWHLDGSDYFGSGHCPLGWDPKCWFDGRNYLDSLPNEEARLLSRQMLSPADVAKHGITAGFTHAHRSADKAIDFIREHRGEDFFLVVSIDEPHHPYICPEPFVSAFQNVDLPLGPAGRDTLADKPQLQREWSRYGGGYREYVKDKDGERVFRHPLFLGCNSFSDHEVGRVLAAIDEHVPDSLVVYTSDHGDMCGRHNIGGKGPAMYDEITRVPFIIRWKGNSPAGVATTNLASHIDLVPTFLDFFGQEIPPALQGTSLLKMVQSPQEKAREEVFIEYHRYEIDHDGYGAFQPIRCAFDGRHKLALNLLDTDEFYDLEADPAEVENRLNRPACAKARDRLHDAILNWMNETRDPLRGPHWARRPWRSLDQTSWGSLPTRPRRFDKEVLPGTLLYATGRPIDRWVYDRG